MIDPEYELAARAWSGIRMLVLERYDRRKEASAALDLSFIRVKALRRIAHGPITMRQLTSHLATDAPYTTLVVSDLEQRGLVARAVHPTDRRSKIVSATTAGAKAAEIAELVLNEPPTPLLDLDPEDLSDLHRIVRTLLHKDNPPESGQDGAVSPRPGSPASA